MNDQLFLPFTAAELATTERSDTEESATTEHSDAAALPFPIQEVQLELPLWDNEPGDQRLVA